MKTIPRNKSMPKWANWIATDSNFNTNYWETKPKKRGAHWSNRANIKTGLWEPATGYVVAMEPFYWKKSLRQIVDIKQPKSPILSALDEIKKICDYESLYGTKFTVSNGWLKFPPMPKVKFSSDFTSNIKNKDYRKENEDLRVSLERRDRDLSTLRAAIKEMNLEVRELRGKINYRSSPFQDAMEAVGMKEISIKSLHDDCEELKNENKVLQFLNGEKESENKEMDLEIKELKRKLANQSKYVGNDKYESKIRCLEREVFELRAQAQNNSISMEGIKSLAKTFQVKK